MPPHAESSPSLAPLLDRALPLDQAAAWCEALLQQIAECHARGRLHGNIRAESLRLDESGVPRLDASEEDVVRLDASSLLPDEVRASSLRTLPASLDAARAELRQRGLVIDPAQLDLRALGGVLCRMLTGGGIESYLQSPRTKGAVPSEWQRVLGGLLACDGARPFDTVAEARAAVRAASSAPPTERPDEAAGNSACEPDTAPSIAGANQAEDTSVGNRAAAVTRDANTGELPKALAHYQIVGRIGQGGMGDVYKAYEPLLDRHVAIKVLPAELARHDEFIRRFRSEATAAARLIHPNIVQVHFIGEDQGRHFFAMQFVEGESLSDLLNRQRRLPPDEAVSIVEHCLQGLSAAHDLGLIHRDIKPGNILIDRRHRRVLLSDFGLVKTLGSTGDGRTTTGVVMGTADYISPEQGRGQAVDARSDLYSIGVMLYRMLSGKLPFEADSPTAMIFQHVYEPPPPLGSVAPDVPDDLVRVVHRLLAKSPDERYQSAAEVLAALKGKPTPPPPAQARKDPKTSDRSTIIFPPAPDSPLLPAESGVLPDDEAAGWLDRLLRGAGRAAKRVAPELIEQLQTTGHQIDDALRLHADRLRELERLTSEAETVLADLRGQAQSIRREIRIDEIRAEPGREPTDQERQALRSAEQFDELAREQESQLHEIQLRRDKSRATLQMLRSQRDALQARLKAAQAQLVVAGGRAPARGWKRLLTPRALAATAAVMAAIAILASFGFPRRGKDSPIAAPHAAEATHQELATRGEATTSGSPSTVAPIVVPDGGVELPISSDREVAQWVLSVGGGLTVQLAGDTRFIDVRETLPEGEFKITGIGLARCKKLPTRGLSPLRGLKSLQNLSLFDNRQVDDATLEPLAGLKSLAQLDLSATQITDDGLRHLSGLRKLTYLNIANTSITGAGLVHLSGFTELESLTMEYLPYSNADLIHLRSFPQLVRLTLRGDRLTDEGLKGIAGLNRLMQLHLSNTGVTSAGLEHLGGLKALQELDLSRTLVDDSGLAHLSGLKNLRDLQLLETAVTGEGLGALAGGQLQAINLEGSPVTDGGIEKIATLTTLQRLNLRKSRTADSGLQHLTRLKKLTWLNLQERTIVPATLDALHALLPSTTIEVTPGMVAPAAGILKSETNRTVVVVDQLTAGKPLGKLAHGAAELMPVDSGSNRGVLFRSDRYELEANGSTWSLRYRIAGEGKDSLLLVHPGNFSVRITTDNVLAYLGDQYYELSTLTSSPKGIRTSEFDKVFPLRADQSYAVVSHLTGAKKWALTIDGKTVVTCDVGNSPELRGVAKAWKEESLRDVLAGTDAIAAVLAGNGPAHAAEDVRFRPAAPMLDGIVTHPYVRPTSLKVDSVVSSRRVVTEVPDAYRAAACVVPEGTPGLLKFTVTKRMTARVAFRDRDWGGGGDTSEAWFSAVKTREQLANEGWREVSRFSTFFKTDDETATWIIYERACRAGETFTMQNHKSCAPIVLVPRTGLPESAGDNTEQRAATWILSVGGRVTLVSMGQGQTVTTAEMIPAASFEITEIELSPRPDATDEGVANLSGLKGVTYVNLTGNGKVGDEGLKHLAGLTTLQNLNLQGTSTTDEGLKHLAGLRNLTHLNLTGTRIKGSGFASLGGLTRLENLRLADCSLDNAEMVHLRNFPKLLALEIRNPRFDDEGLQGVAPLKELGHLSLGGTRVTSAGLAHLSELANLDHLAISGGRVDDDGLKHIPGRQLRSLMFSSVPLTGEGFKALAAPNLVELHLGNARLTDAGMQEIAKFKTLEKLVFGKVSVSQESLLSLGGLKRLTYLDLTESEVKQSTLDALRKAIPDLKIAFTPDRVESGE